MKNKYKNLKMIVCVGENNLIGDKNPEGNGLLWNVKEELKYFKNVTIGNILLFGLNTANIVPLNLMKKDREVFVLDDNIDIDKLIYELSKKNKDIFICGGYSIYKYFLDNFEISEIYVSELKKTVFIKEAKNPLYLPKLENYGYQKELIKEYNEFYAYKYVKK